VPGLLGDRGVLEFAEDVWLDYEHPDNAITVSFSLVLALGLNSFLCFSPPLQFNLATTSNLRVYVEEHHVDIDLRLSNASGKSPTLWSSLCVFAWQLTLFSISGAQATWPSRSLLAARKPSS
jgi:hypothetical protein